MLTNPRAVATAGADARIDPTTLTALPGAYSLALRYRSRPYDSPPVGTTSVSGITLRVNTETVPARNLSRRMGPLSAGSGCCADVYPLRRSTILFTIKISRSRGFTVNTAQQKEWKMSVGDKISNAAEDAKGKIKEGAGKATGNDKLEAEGKGDQVKAELKKAGENVKDSFKH